MKKPFRVLSYAAIVIGAIMTSAGVYGLVFTYSEVVQEDITTHKEATIPNVPVRRPLTLKAQADIIRVHTLRITGGKTYAEMPSQVPKLDAGGRPVLDKNNKPVMVENTARDIWITATTLINSLNLALLTYAFSVLAILFGFVSVCIGVVLLVLSKKSL